MKVPMAGTFIMVAESAEEWVRSHAAESEDAAVHEALVETVLLGIQARRYAERGIEDDATIEATYLPDSRT